MRTKLLILMIASATALAGCTSPAPTAGGQGPPAADPPTEALEAVPMINHVQFGVFEQDVYIEKPTDPGKVYRATPADAANPLFADAPLFGTAAPNEHDPSFQDAGPFDKGKSLGLTLREWLAGRGAAAYLCTGGETARIDASFSGLVPDGLYTMWNARLDMEGGAIVGGEDLPAGPADGSRNTFTADAEGNAHFAVAWDGCNPESTAGPGIGPDGSAWVLAIAWHSDGKSYGASPGPFGQHTHVQVFGMMKAKQA